MVSEVRSLVRSRSRSRSRSLSLSTVGRVCDVVGKFGVEIRFVKGRISSGKMPSTAADVEQLLCEVCEP